MLLFICSVVLLGALTQAAVVKTPQQSSTEIPSEVVPGSVNSKNEGRNNGGMNDTVHTKEQPEGRKNQGVSQVLSGVISIALRWPNAVVPFTVDVNLPPEQNGLIPEAMNMIQDRTCVRFVQQTNEANYINILRRVPGMCSSRVGRGGGAQDLNLGGFDANTPCPTGTVAHELMHALGIEHEQNRPDRNNHIFIDFQNIPPLWRRQYNLDDPQLRSVFGLPYNFGSIMHYPVWAPGRPDVQVMFPLDPNVNINTVGQTMRLSDGDVALINALYCPPQPQ